MTEGGTPRRSPARPVASFLELLGLSGLVVAQPLLASFSDAGEIFVAVAAGPLDIVLFVLAVVLGPPLALLAVELVAGLFGERPGRLAHLASIFVLLALLAVRVGKEVTELGWKRLSVLAVVVALALAAAVWRSAVVRSFLRFLAAAPVALAVLFVVASPITGLLLADDEVAPAEVAPASPAPVLWIVFDELPLVSLLDGRDRIDAERFPNFAELAGDATFYRNTTTVSPQTRQAVPALLDGRFPEDPDTLPTVAEHEENLFTLLGGSYDLNVSESWTSLCPTNLCPDTARARGSALAALFEEANTLWRRQALPKRNRGGLDTEAEIFGYRDRQFRDFLASLDEPEGGRPPLDFLHLLLPHQRFEYLPSGTRYRGADEFGLFLGEVFDDDAGDAFRMRHVLQLMYTDRLLGQVLDRVRELGRYDESLVVVTGDHGIGFTDDAPLRGLDEGNLHEILWTPLLVKAPGQRRGVVDDGPMRSTDVLPTVAAELGLDLPEGVDGVAGGPEPGARGDDEREVQTWEYDRLDGGDDDVIAVDAAAGFEEVLAAEPPVEGAAGDELAPYRTGRFGALVGRRVEDLDVGRPVEVEGWLDGEGRYRDVDLDERQLPVWVSGGLEIDAGEPLRVAVAVNGVVGGWSPVYLTNYLNEGLRPPRPDQDRLWGTVVPEQLLRDGRNEVEVFLLGEDPDDELRPLDHDGDD